MSPTRKVRVERADSTRSKCITWATTYRVSPLLSCVLYFFSSSLHLYLLITQHKPHFRLDPLASPVDSSVRRGGGLERVSLHEDRTFESTCSSFLYFSSTLHSTLNRYQETRQLEHINFLFVVCEVLRIVPRERRGKPSVSSFYAF